MVISSIYFLSTVMVLASGCTSHEWYKKELSSEVQKQYSPQVRAGRGYFYQGRVPEQFQLKEAFRLDSTDADLWREFGTARVKRGILDEMDYWYGGAVDRKPEKWAGFRGYLYRDFPREIADFNLGDEDNGLVDYSQGQSHDYMRGICYYGLKDYETAITYLDRYITKITEEEGESWVDVIAFLYRALSLLQLEQYDEAMAEFDRALKYYPNMSDCFYHKARIYIARGQFDLARQQLDKAEEYFQQGYYHLRPYVEVLEQIYIQDIRALRDEISTS